MTIQINLSFCWLKAWHIGLVILILSNLGLVLLVEHQLNEIKILDETYQDKTTQIQYGCINPPPNCNSSVNAVGNWIKHLEGSYYLALIAFIPLNLTAFSMINRKLKLFNFNIKGLD